MDQNNIENTRVLSELNPKEQIEGIRSCEFGKKKTGEKNYC